MRVEVNKRRAGEQIGRVIKLAVSVNVGQEIEFKQGIGIGEDAAEMQVAALFEYVFGIRIVGADTAVAKTQPGAEPVVEIITSDDACGYVRPVEATVGIEVAEIVGSANPATQFPAPHLAERILLLHQHQCEHETAKFDIFQALGQIKAQK